MIRRFFEIFIVIQKDIYIAIEDKMIEIIPKESNWQIQNRHLFVSERIKVYIIFLYFL